MERQLRSRDRSASVPKPSQLASARDATDEDGAERNIVKPSLLLHPYQHPIRLIHPALVWTKCKSRSFSDAVFVAVFLATVALYFTSNAKNAAHPANRKSSASLRQTASTRTTRCESIFLGGIKEQTDSSKVWKDLQCDKLFRENGEPEEVCQSTLCPWTRTAIRALLVPGTEWCTTERANRFLVDPELDGYRISDIFRWRKGLDIDGLLRKYSGTIMDEYNHTVIRRRGYYMKTDYESLYQVVKQRAMSATDLPGPNTAVVHLRMGDVIDFAVESVEDLLLEQHYFYRLDKTKTFEKYAGHPLEVPDHPELQERWNKYVRPLHFFSQVDWSRHPEVVLLGSAHMEYIGIPGKSTPLKSCHYAYALKTYIERFGVNVTLRLGRSPDDDLLFASQAKVFVQGGGGFSKLLAELVRMSGGSVINANFWTGV